MGAADDLRPHAGEQFDRVVGMAGDDLAPAAVQLRVGLLQQQRPQFLLAVRRSAGEDGVAVHVDDDVGADHGPATVRQGHRPGPVVVGAAQLGQPFRGGVGDFLQGGHEVAVADVALHEVVARVLVGVGHSARREWAGQGRPVPLLCRHLVRERVGDAREVAQVTGRVGVDVVGPPPESSPHVQRHVLADRCVGGVARRRWDGPEEPVPRPELGVGQPGDEL